jgi:hypothetical protein
VPRAARPRRLLERMRVPPDYVPQVTHNLWVTGAEFVDFVSYCPQMPEDLQLVIVRATREEFDIAGHEAAVLRFLAEAELMEQRLRWSMSRLLHPMPSMGEPRRVEPLGAWPEPRPMTPGRIAQIQGLIARNVASGKRHARGRGAADRHRGALRHRSHARVEDHEQEGMDAHMSAKRGGKAGFVYIDGQPKRPEWIVIDGDGFAAAGVDFRPGEVARAEPVGRGPRLHPGTRSAAEVRRAPADDVPAAGRAHLAGRLHLSDA